MLERILRLFRLRRRSAASDMSSLDLAEANFEDLPILELDKYQALVQEFPPPTDDQFQRFAVYVSEAKSWYKHLPARPPGVPFQFFVDPWAGLDRIRLPGGTATFTERTETSHRFHYTWMTTTSYRAQFGRLAFSCEAGSELFLPGSTMLEDGTTVNGLLDNNPSHAVIYTASNRPFRLPNEILEAGCANVTALVHKIAATIWFWEMVFSKANYEPVWFEDTGLADAVARIQERCRRVAAENNTSDSDPEIDAILKPERERLQAGMVNAMRRMRDLVYPTA